MDDRKVYTSVPTSVVYLRRVSDDDGIVLLPKGRVVYERYFGVRKAEGQHGAMSVTKTLVGTLAAEGKLDTAKRVDHYVPELAASAFGSATVRQVMDMTTGIKFSEDYADPNAEVWAHGAAGNPLPKPRDYTGPRTYYEFLQTVKPQGTHGEAFHYRTANTDALGWILARVTGKSVAQLLSERIWSQIGAEQDAYMSVDSIGTPFAGGGLSTGLRDLARFGEMIRNNGAFSGRQIVPASAVADIRRGGSKADFAQAGYTLLPGAIATCGGSCTTSAAPSPRLGGTARPSTSTRPRCRPTTRWPSDRALARLARNRSKPSRPDRSGERQQMSRLSQSTSLHSRTTEKALVD